MTFDIPGGETINLKHVVFDYNGTIALDGKLIEGVGNLINELSADLNFHVITADTYGSVEQELAGINCKVVKIAENNQDLSKRDFVRKLGTENTLSVGNGRNDKLMLQESILGIAIIQSEGAYLPSIMAADIACQSIMDVFGFFKVPNRLRATLRN